MKYIDYILDRITMYRLVLYLLIVMVVAAAAFMLLGILPYNVGYFGYEIVLVVSLCWLTNKLFSLVFTAPTNVESVYITALILVLIIAPANPFSDLPLLIGASVISMASKYILAYHRKHVFNPAALAVLLTSLVLGQQATWWVGTTVMVPFVAVSGFLLWRKLRKVDMVFTFMLTVLVVLFGITIFKGSDWFTQLDHIFLHSSFLFFAVIMLTEPLTMPPTHGLQVIYGALVGLLFVPDIHVASIYSTPELALVLGNIFAYIVSPKEKLLLTLKEKIRLSPDIFQFIFTSDIKPKFSAGQYMELTFPHSKTDTRGNRRYLTVASSPTEDTVEFGIKFAKQSSSYKFHLAQMKQGDKLIAGQLSGEFTLPANKNQKIVWMAGGIGVTPYRSMMKYLIDKQEKRSITLFYSNNTQADIVYEDIFSEAEQKLGIKTIYTLTKQDQVPADWKGKVGFIDADMIKQAVSDFKTAIYYISGPHMMVEAMKGVLTKMGVSRSHIKTDYFPGFV